MCHLSHSSFTQVRTAHDTSLTAILSWKSNKDFWEKSQLCSTIYYTGSYECCASLGYYLDFVEPETLKSFYSLVRLSILWWMILVWICLREKPRGKRCCQKTCKHLLKSSQVEHSCTSISTYVQSNNKTNTKPAKQKTKPNLHHKIIPVSLIKIFRLVGFFFFFFYFF